MTPPCRWFQAACEEPCGSEGDCLMVTVRLWHPANWLFALRWWQNRFHGPLPVIGGK